MKGAFLLILIVLLAPLLARADDNELNLYAWSEYVPQEVLDGFTKETGIKVNYSTYDSNEKLLQSLLIDPTQYDLVQPSEYMVQTLIRLKKLEPLDHSRLPNLKNILPEYLNMEFDPGNQFSVPYMAGTVLIVWNSDKVPGSLNSFADVFQAKNAGDIIVVKDNRELVAWALRTIGLSVNDVNADTLDKVKPILSQWVKLIKKYDSDSPKTDLLEGNVDIGVIWNGEAAILLSDKRFKVAVPAEGAHRYVDNLAIPVGAKHKEAAEKLIDYILRPEVSKIISDKWPYTNPNGAARKLLSPEQLNNAASYPDLKNPEMFKDIGKNARLVDQMMSDVLAGD
jgi:spermidine/putrescine transport system substrate-binding protein